MNELQKIDSFSYEVAIAETIDEIKMLSTKGEIMAEMAKKLKIPIDGQNKPGRTRIELEKRKRELIEQMFPRGAKPGTNNREIVKSQNGTLQNVGITRKESSDAKIIKEEDELVEEIIKEIEDSGSVIEPKKVASLVRKKKKEKQKEKKQKEKHKALENIPENKKDSFISIEPGWYKVNNQFLYFGSNLDKEFIEFLPKDSAFAFADPPYNANVDEWDNGFIWQQDYLQDIAKTVAVTPGGWNAFEFYRQTKMNYQWEMFCWITNGMTHGKCGFANVIKASIFGKQKPKISQDFWKINIRVNETDHTKHKGRKPYEFMYHLIDMFSDKGEKIIDPFAGSGTTLIVSEQMGRISYNAELSKDFCVEIIKRAGHYERI